MRLVIAALCATTAFAGSPAFAELPVIPEIPAALSDAGRGPLLMQHYILTQRRKALVESGLDFNRNCANVLKGSTAYNNCVVQQSNFNKAVAVLVEDVRGLTMDLDLAIQEDIAHLNTREHILTAAIARDAVAIRRLGFDRRAEDFEAWVALSDDAQKAFAESVCRVSYQEGNGPKECVLHRMSLASVAYSINISATQLVAAHEVKRLTAMTETELNALRKIDELLIKHVKERRLAQTTREALEPLIVQIIHR